MNDTYTQLGLAVIGTVGSAIFAFRYLIGKLSIMQKGFLESQKENQASLLEYVEKKNGHLERISNRFADSSDTLAGKIGELTVHIDSLAKVKRKR